MPGTVAGLIPWLLTGWEVRDTLWPPIRLVGVLLLAAGVAVLLHAFLRFVVEGVGTPAPIAPTKHLVVGGLYRYVRNPMYLAVAATIVGQALALGQLVLLVYAAVFAVTSTPSYGRTRSPRCASSSASSTRSTGARCRAGGPAHALVGELRRARSPRRRYGPAMPNREFAELQQRLRALWPSVTLRSIGDVERTVVVVHSISMDVPDQLIPVFPAYEERFLCLVLSLLRSRNSRVVYVTSQPILPRLIDYYFGLVPELDTPEARSRFSVVSLVDARNLPLTKKLLARPGAIERIRALVAEPELAFLLPFATSRDEVELAVRLGIPLYGADPALEWLGTKTGSRRVFAEEGVPHARGFDVAGERDVLDCAARAAERDGHPQARPRRQRPRQRTASTSRRALEDGALAEALSLEDTEADVGDYLAALADQGGIVEERIEGDDFRSPSAQLRISPSGPGRHPLHARPGPRRAARPDVLRLPLPRRPGVRAADRCRSAQGRTPAGA